MKIIKWLKSWFVRSVEGCTLCKGLGYLSYNPNLNPNLFEGIATCKCPLCGGTRVKQ